MASPDNLDSKIYHALLTRMQGLSGAPAIVQPGEVYPKNAATPFIVLDDLRNDNERIHADDAGQDYLSGVFVATVMTPLTFSHTQRLGVVDTVCARFSKGTAVTYDDVTLKMRKRPQPVGTGFQDGAHFRIPVNIYWEIVA